MEEVSCGHFKTYHLHKPSASPEATVASCHPTNDHLPSESLNPSLLQGLPEQVRTGIDPASSARARILSLGKPSRCLVSDPHNPHTIVSAPH